MIDEGVRDKCSTLEELFLQAENVRMQYNHKNVGTNIRLYTAPPQEGLVVLYLSE